VKFDVTVTTSSSYQVSMYDCRVFIPVFSDAKVVKIAREIPNEVTCY